MDRQYIDDQTFDKNHPPALHLRPAEYDNCTFTACDLANADLSGLHFSKCLFTDCNLSMAKLSNTAFKDVRFAGCKLLGLPFGQCDHFLFSVQFDHCVLNLSSFYKLPCKKTRFMHCSLREADFVETDLTEASFDHCDLFQAVFENTILEKADFRAALHYVIDPANNRIGKARFSLPGLPGLLGSYDIIID